MIRYSFIVEYYSAILMIMIKVFMISRFLIAILFYIRYALMALLRHEIVFYLSRMVSNSCSKYTNVKYVASIAEGEVINHKSILFRKFVTTDLHCKLIVCTL